MFRLGTVKVLVVVAGVLVAGGLMPAQAAPTQAIYEVVHHTWISPGGGEALNAIAGEGAFGYTVMPADFSSGFAGRCFSLKDRDGVTDLDIYFHVGGDPTSSWDTTTGVTSGAEHGRVPAGVTRAFVMISYFNAAATDITFELKVFDAATC